MKILGAIIYMLGFLIIGYIITETRIDLGGSFGGIVFMFVLIGTTMTIGSLLMNYGNNDDKKD